jgi:hypothetical protein
VRRNEWSTGVPQATLQDSFASNARGITFSLVHTVVAMHCIAAEKYFCGHTLVSAIGWISLLNKGIHEPNRTESTPDYRP